MKKFFIAVISLAIFAMASYGIAYIVIPVNSIELTEYTHSVDIKCDSAYIVREETVYYSTSDGTVYNIVSDGDRVSQNSSISTTYNGDVDGTALKQLRTIDTKINKLKALNTEGELYKTDSASSESEIASKMSEVIELAKSNDIERIHDIREDINALRSGESVSINQKIETLYADRINVEASMPVSKTDTVADTAGIFSSYIDGLESVLTPERIKEYSPSYINSLNTQQSEYINGKSVIIGDPICKVMNNHNWYVLGIVDSEHKSLIAENPGVTVKFPSLSGSSVKGTIDYVSEPDEEGNSLFLVKVQTYLESAFSFRNIDVQVVFNEYSGYKVPTDSIHTGEGMHEYYVYARKGSGAYKCDVEILYSDTTDGYSIIQSTDDASNKLASMERLVVGER